jgi:hypothetical protein
VQLTNVSPLAVSEATAGKGWIYNYATGDIIVNCDNPDEGGTVNYDAY